MRANWFVGLPVEGSWMADRVPPPPHEVRLFHPGDLHLTVAFLGPCGEERARRGWGALEAALGGLGPAVDATLGEVVPMGSPRRYTALSALLVQGRADTEALIGRARDPICAAAEVAPDPRPPKAHLTIARPTRRATDAQRRAALAWAGGLDLRSVAVRIDRLALYTWSEDRATRLFHVVEQRTLAP